MHFVSLGYHCNNSCVFCAQGALRLSDPRLQEESVQRQIAGIPRKLGAREVVAFVGGEPTLQERLPFWISEVRDLGLRNILAQTNGRRLAYPGYARSLSEAGLSSVDISLHGSTTAMHEYHTQVPGSFAQTALGIRHAREAGLDVGVSVVVTRSNFRHLEDIIRLAARQGAAAVHLAPAAPWGKAHSQWARVVPAMERVLPFLIQAIRSCRGLGMDVMTEGLVSSEKVRNSFAGLGATEPRPATPSAGPERRAAASPPKRPARGRSEVRSPQRKTGEALREIFPGLFKGTP